MIYRTFPGNVNFGNVRLVSGSRLWLPIFIAGMVFMALSVVLVLKPELLAFFFAGVLMFFGIAMVSTALFFRAFMSKSQVDEVEFL